MHRFKQDICDIIESKICVSEQLKNEILIGICSAIDGISENYDISVRNGLQYRAKHSRNGQRCVTAYNMFVKENMKPGRTLKEIGIEWRELDIIEKESYAEKAQRANGDIINVKKNSQKEQAISQDFDSKIVDGLLETMFDSVNDTGEICTHAAIIESVKENDDCDDCRIDQIINVDNISNNIEKNTFSD